MSTDKSLGPPRVPKLEVPDNGTANLTWALATIAIAGATVISATPWLTIDVTAVVWSLVLVCALWILWDLLLPARAVWIARGFTAAISIPIVFAKLGGMYSPPAVLLALPLTLIVLIAYEGWQRWLLGILIWIGFAFVALASHPEMRFVLPQVSDATHWIWHRSSLAASHPSEETIGGEILVYLVLLAILMPLWVKVTHVVRPRGLRAIAAGARLQTLILSRIPAALTDRQGRIVQVSEALAQLSDACRGANLRDLFDILDGQCCDGLATNLTRAHANKWSIVKCEDVGENRQLVTFRPFGPDALMGHALQSCSQAWIACWPDGQVAHFNTAAAELVPNLLASTDISGVFIGDPGNPELIERLDRKVIENYWHGRTQFCVTVTPIILAGTHVFSNLWICENV